MCWMRHDRQRMPPLRVLAAYAAVALIWGSTWAAIKIGVAEVPPFIFAFDRAVAVAVILTLVALSLRQPFPRGGRELVVVAVVGIINTGGSWAIIFWAEQFVPSGLVAVFGASAPVWTAFLAHFLIKGDRLSALKIAGLGFGLLGIALLVGAPGASESRTVLLATGLLVLMTIAWAVAAILQARFLRRVAPIPTVALGTWAAVLFLVPFALTQAAAPHPRRPRRGSRGGRAPPARDAASNTYDTGVVSGGESLRPACRRLGGDSGDRRLGAEPLHKRSHAPRALQRRGVRAGGRGARADRRLASTASPPRAVSRRGHRAARRGVGGARAKLCRARARRARAGRPRRAP